jgi:hypothetical protein
VGVDERPHHFARRSSSAFAKYAAPGERLGVARTLARELVAWWYYRVAGYL